MIPQHSESSDNDEVIKKLHLPTTDNDNEQISINRVVHVSTGKDGDELATIVTACSDNHGFATLSQIMRPGSRAMMTPETRLLDRASRLEQGFDSQENDTEVHGSFFSKNH